jgi:GNAT superfamily N-acetyltransferase
MGSITIRPYRRQDRDSVRAIARDTAFLGNPADIFFSSPEILVDFLTVYFTDYEPQSCFVAEFNGEVVGYIVGAKDTSRMNRVFINKIAPGLLAKAVFKLALFKPRNILFFFFTLMSLFRREFAEPDVSVAYPAVLHINLKEGFRGQGSGSSLIKVYLDYLAAGGCTGVHLATMSERASLFFEKAGFKLLHKGRRSYFRYILHTDIPIYIFVKTV